MYRYFLLTKNKTALQRVGSQKAEVVLQGRPRARCRIVHDSVSFEEHADDDVLANVTDIQAQRKSRDMFTFYFIPDMRCTPTFSQGLRSAGTYNEALEIPNDNI